MRKFTANATHAAITLAVTAAAVFTAFALPLPAQAVTITLFGGTGNIITGSGKEVAVARPVGAFSALRLDSSVDVRAHQGTTPSITVHADDNIEPLTAADLLRLATEIEGHPDNAAAALLGGFVVVGPVGDTIDAIRFEAPRDLRAVLFIVLMP